MMIIPIKLLNFNNLWLLLLWWRYTINDAMIIAMPAPQPDDNDNHDNVNYDDDDD